MDKMKRIGKLDLDQNMELIQLVLYLLNSTQEIPKEVLESLLENAQFMKLYATIQDIRELSYALSIGDLQSSVYSKGYIADNLNSIKSRLHNLTSQTKRISENDYGGRMDFWGDISINFNNMADKLQETNQHLKYLANIDCLTKLPNRQSLIDFLLIHFDNAVRYNRDLCVMIIDIDFFKNINDTYGHNVGDQVLVQISRKLNLEFRTTDVLARYGGEEFMAVLPNTTVINGEKIAQRLKKMIESSVFFINSELELNLTISIGVSCISAVDQNYENLIKKSDLALYEAKNKGRNCVCIYKGSRETKPL